MIYDLKILVEHCSTNAVKIDGEWVPARPWRWPLWWRCKAAWLVLRGKADAVVWPGGQ